MNKKISKIITGVAMLGCLGAFLPSQVSAESCHDFTTKEKCKENHCDWKKEGGYCFGVPANCVYLTRNQCTSGYSGCIWAEAYNVCEKPSK